MVTLESGNFFSQIAVGFINEYYNLIRTNTADAVKSANDRISTAFETLSFRCNLRDRRKNFRQPFKIRKLPLQLERAGARTSFTTRNPSWSARLVSRCRKR